MPGTRHIAKAMRACEEFRLFMAYSMTLEREIYECDCGSVMETEEYIKQHEEQGHKVRLIKYGLVK